MVYPSVFVMEKEANGCIFLKSALSLTDRALILSLVNKLTFQELDMDKSFNDDELSDIMKEIEALEKDFKQDEIKEASPVLEELVEMKTEEAIPVAAQQAEDITETQVEEIVAETVEVIAPVAENVVAFEAPKASVAAVTPEAQAPVASTAAAPATNASHTSMSFKVQGNLTLELSFDIGGKVVSLEVTETGLNIEMDGGVKFTVPVAATTAAKKAA